MEQVEGSRPLGDIGECRKHMRCLLQQVREGLSVNSRATLKDMSDEGGGGGGTENDVSDWSP